MPKPPKHKQHPQVTAALPEVIQSLRTHNHAHAINTLTNLLPAAPNDARLHDYLSTALALAKSRERAAHHAQQALTLNPNDTPLARRAISVLQRAGSYNDALAHTERALYQSPKDPTLNTIKVTLLTDLGKHRQAAKTLDAHTKSNPPSSPADALALAVLAARLSPAAYPPPDLITQLTPLVTDDSIPAPLRKAASFQLARLQELEAQSESQYTAAFNTYTLANTLALKDQTWDPAAHSTRIDTLIKQLTAAYPSIPTSTINDPTQSPKPVFILGMMRSGSSLLEQLLAQLQGLTPADEQSEIFTQIHAIEHTLNPTNQNTQLLPLPLSITSYTQDHINQIAAAAASRYEHFAKQTPSTTLITDKQTEHYHLIPLLPKLFPNCTIIHTNRDPLDTCLSNFTQSYAQGHPHTAKLEWIAQYHNDHDRLLRAWKKLPDLTIHEVNYADLVTNPQQETQRLAEILNLPWTNKVLDFHKSNRTVATASQDQVRQPLYTTSIGRAQRFAKHLQPLTDTLITPTN